MNPATMPEGVGVAFDFVMDKLGTVVTTIAGNPLLCIGIGFFIVGGAIGLFRRIV